MRVCKLNQKQTVELTLQFGVGVICNYSLIRLRSHCERGSFLVFVVKTSLDLLSTIFCGYWIKLSWIAGICNPRWGKVSLNQLNEWERYMGKHDEPLELSIDIRTILRIITIALMKFVCRVVLNTPPFFLSETFRIVYLSSCLFYI